MESPKTQMYAEGQSPTDAEDAFKQQFASMAYENFSQKHPDLVDSITGFRVEKVDLYDDLGVGVIQLVYMGTEVQVPMIVSGGRLFPSNIMYLVDKKRFVPFDKTWINIAQSNTPITVGTPTEMPDSVATDRDLRHIMQPPQTGRYSFAHYVSPVQKSLLTFLLDAPNNVKVAFINYMRSSDKIATYVVRRYGSDKLGQVLAANPNGGMNKLAADTVYEDVGVYDLDTPHATIRSVFKTAAPRALATIYARGYVIADERDQRRTKVAVFQENLMRLTSVGPTGIYTVFKKNGDAEKAFITDKCVSLGQPGVNMRKALPGYSSDADVYSVYSHTDSRNPRAEYRQGHLLIYTESGDYYTSSEGVPRRFAVGVVDDERPVLDRLFPHDNTSSSITMGKGFFILVNGGRISSTTPIDIKRVMNSEGVEYASGVCLDTGKDVTIRRDDVYPAHDIEIFSSTNQVSDVYIPKAFLFVKIRESLPLTDLEGRTMSIIRMAKNKAINAGMVSLHIGKDDMGEMHLDGCPMKIADAVKSLLTTYDMSYASASNVMRRFDKMHKRAHLDLLVSNNLTLHKVAQEDVPLDGATPNPEDIQEAGQDPEAVQEQAQDPELLQQQMQEQAMQEQGLQEQAAQEQQQQPGPLDMALQDIMTIVQAQRDEIQQKFENELAILSAREEAMQLLQGRAMSIAQGAPPLDYNATREFARDPSIWSPAAPEVPTLPPDAMEGAIDSEEQMGVEGDPAQQQEGEIPVDEQGQPLQQDPQQDPQQVAQGQEQPGQMPEGNFEATAIASLMNDANVDNFGAEYLPQIQETIDKLARTLLELYMKAPYFRKQMGEVEFDAQVNRLNKQIKDLGDVTAAMYQQSLVLPDETA